MAPSKKIKTEPPESVGYAEYEDSFALGACSTDINGDALLNFTLDGYKTPSSTKHTSSPAQEATRAKISTCETQLKKLYKQRASGKIDSKGTMQIRCLEEDLRKAHAKLRRLLNEAERQRRRRERLRCGLSASPLSSPAASTSSNSKMLMIVRGSGRHDYDGLPTIASYGSHNSEVVTSGFQDDGVMTALKQCSRFEDFVRELNSFGYTLNRVSEDNHVVYDVPEDGESGADGEVRVQVELIEGDAALEQQQQALAENEVEEIKTEPLSPPPSSPALSDCQVAPPRSGASATTAPTTAPNTTTSTNNNENNNRNEGHATAESSAESSSTTKTQATSVKAFAAEYARRHSLCLREWQEQYQDWYERQVEAQQHWEESFMREQMELTKSMLENITSTFLQGMQQILQNSMASIGRRSMPPFLPTFSSRGNLDLNGLNINQSDMPMFVSDVGSNGPTVLSTRSLSEDPNTR